MASLRQERGMTGVEQWCCLRRSLGETFSLKLALSSAEPQHSITFSHMSCRSLCLTRWRVRPLFVFSDSLFHKCCPHPLSSRNFSDSCCYRIEQSCCYRAIMLHHAIMLRRERRRRRASTSRPPSRPGPAPWPAPRRARTRSAPRVLSSPASPPRPPRRRRRPPRSRRARTARPPQRPAPPLRRAPARQPSCACPAARRRGGSPPLRPLRAPPRKPPARRGCRAARRAERRRRR